MYDLAIVCTTAVTGKHVQLYNNKDHPIVLLKGTAIARMVTANEVPGKVVADGTVGTLQTHRWAKEGHVEERRKVLFWP